MQATRLYTILAVSLFCSATANLIEAQTITHVPLYTFYGESEFDGFGDSVSGAGDVNGDGKADLIIGAPADSNGRGYVHVLSGSDGSVLYNFRGDCVASRFGDSVSGAGDVNGDGMADLIVGTPFEDNNGVLSGSARVLSGSDGSVLYNFRGDSATDRFGFSVSGAGDVNGDGLDDLIVGADLDDNNGPSSGSARVLSGSDGSVLYNFDGDEGERLGTSVSGAGDVNGDGMADLIVGAEFDDNNGPRSGSARVFSGSDGSVLYTFNGGSEFDFFGRSVSGAGDVNGDGMADLIVGAPFEDNNGDFSGSARVLSGSDGSVLFNFDGDVENDRLGISVSSAGDVNGDGMADLIVGVPFDGNNGPASGSARVLSGSNGRVLYSFDGDSTRDRFGNSVSGAGDVNGDGIDDFIVGAGSAGSSRASFARVFVSQMVPLGDCNLDGVVDFLDIAPFIAILSAGDFLIQADINDDDVVNFLDISPFITLLSL